MAEPVSMSAVLASALTGAKAAAPYVLPAAGGVLGAALTKPDKPKKLSNPDPDSKKKRLDNERDLARRYSEQGRVSSMFNKDKLG